MHNIQTPIQYTVLLLYVYQYIQLEESNRSQVQFNRDEILEYIMQYTTFRAARGWAMHPPISITSSIQHICNSRIRIAIYNFCFLQLHPRVVESVLHKHCSGATEGVQQQSRSRTGHAPSHVPDHLQMTLVMYVMFSERRFVDAIEITLNI
jgi:hypothetical protein